jgi:hypothetical protein
MTNDDWRKIVREEKVCEVEMEGCEVIVGDNFEIR